jgi:two-component system response regulator
VLVLSRGCDTSIQIGPNITVKVLSIQKQRVKLGVDAPSHIRVLREEIAPVGEDQNSAGSPTSGTFSPDSYPILVVEDDPGHALLITKALEQCLLSSVSVASTGAAAMESLAGRHEAPEWRPSLVFLDYHLPDMSGLEVLRRIRSDPRLKTMPVVILSGEQRESVVAECLEAGANAFVAKSFQFDDFCRSVTRTATFWTNECRVPKPCVPQPA